VAQRSPQDEALLAAVDRGRAAELVLEVADLERVGVGRSCHLPESHHVTVVLAGGEVAEDAEHVTLRLDDHRRDVQVGADLRRRATE
jgi:hypothetical protein